MNNHKCSKCSFENNKEILKNKAINKLKEKYPELDFSKFNYINRDSKSTVICHIHGEFESSYLNLSKSKYGCKKCNKNIYIPKSKLKSKEEAVKELQNKFPNLNFSKFEYINNKIKGIVICPIHGEFERSYNNLYTKNRSCPKCTNKHYSKAEKEIVEYIKTFYDKCIEENNRNIILNEYTNNYLELDIYLPDINLAIEFNGIYYHSDEMIRNRTNNIFKTAEEYHKYKSNKCDDKNIKLLHIDEQDWLDDKFNLLNNIKNEILSLV